MNNWSTSCKRSLLVGTALAAGVLGVPALTLAAADSPVFEEVIVTARKRAERAIDVPDSITAFSAAEIEERRIDRIDDVLGLAANLHVVHDQDSTTNIVVVRGIGTSRLLDAAVAFSVDGVIMPNSDGFMVDLSDAESIEVLRGPQGALYGRNAIAGVINVTTKRPGQELEGQLRGGYGNGDTFEAFAALSGALVEEKLAVRVTGKYKNSDGFIRNSFNGETVDHDERGRVTARLIYTPTDTLEIDLRAAHMEQKGGADMLSAFDVQGVSGGEITSDMAKIMPNLNDPVGSKWHMTNISMMVNWTTDAGRLSSTTAYDDMSTNWFGDLDITALPVAVVRQLRATEGWSQELRFTSPDEKRLRYIVGGYYQDTNRDVITDGALDFCFLVPLPGCPTPPGTISGRTELSLNSTSGDARQWALFVQSSFDITPQLEVTGALRYDNDRRKQHDLLSGRNDSGSFKDLQPKVSLAWKPDSNLTVYGTFAEGYKSGGFNQPPVPGGSYELIVRKEQTRAYEVGLKSELFDRRLRFNVSAFYTDYTDPQIFQLDLTTGGQVAINGRKARIQGVEYEMSFHPIDRVEVHSSGGYSDARIQDFNGTALYVDNWLPNSPKFTFNFGGRIDLVELEVGTVVLRADYNRTGRIYYSESNDIFQPTYDTVDGQLSLDTENWTISLWGRNIFSKNYIVSAFSRATAPILLVPLNIDIYQIAPGAQYGLDLNYRF